MSSLFSPEQREFARSMSERQWAVLLVIADAPFFMSASERIDPALYALIRNKLAYAFSIAPEMFGLQGWSATAAGKALVKRRRAGTL